MLSFTDCSVWHIVDPQLIFVERMIGIYPVFKTLEVSDLPQYLFQCSLKRIPLTQPHFLDIYVNPLSSFHEDVRAGRNFGKIIQPKSLILSMRKPNKVICPRSYN